VYKNGQVEVEFKDIKVEDQYGRAFDDVEKDYTINVTSKDANKIAVDGNNTFANLGDKVVIKGVDGSATVDFELVSNYTKESKDKVATDKHSVTFRTVDEDDFDSYVVK